MKDFNFKIPQNIQFGMGSLKKLPEILAENHSDNILLVSDRGLEKIGVVKKVQDIIEAAGLKCTSYLDVVPNPTVAVVNEATALYKECGATSIVALGGGSSMDVGKAVGVLVNYGGKITINLGAQSEKEAKDTVLTDPTAAADVYAFADDQLNELVQAGALQEVQLNADDIKSRNTAASVDAATLNGKLYAYPLTADNGYFMFYDKSFFTEDDVKSLDTMMEKAAAAGKKVSMDVANGWYLYSFYAGAGLNLSLADDGVNTVCNWNEAPGADVTQAVIDICKNPGFLALKDEEFTGKLKDGTLVAGVNGTWRANDAAEVWGDNYAACKLPTYTLNGEQVQMASFSGYKLIGVNPHSANVGAAMLLADFVTNEENEELRFKERAQGPSNTNALAAASSPALTAVVAQSEYANLQRVGGNYWASAETLGQICVNGNPDGKDTQTLVDDAVAGITAPVTQ